MSLALPIYSIIHTIFSRVGLGGCRRGLGGGSARARRGLGGGSAGCRGGPGSENAENVRKRSKTFENLRPLANAGKARKSFVFRVNFGPLGASVFELFSCCNFEARICRKSAPRLDGSHILAFAAFPKIAHFGASEAIENLTFFVAFSGTSCRIGFHFK